MLARRARAGNAVSLAVIAGAVCVAPALPRAQSPRGPGVNEEFGTIAEGYTSELVGGPIEAAYRMFSAPDFAAVCAAARAGDVRSLRAARARIDGRVGVPVPYTALEVDALDALGVLVPKVPIAIESAIGSGVLDVRQDHIGADNVTPKAPGTIKVRVRTICDAPGGETFVTLDVK